MDTLYEVIADYYWLAGLLALGGVYVMLFAHGAAGKRQLLRAAVLQWVLIVILVITTPFVLFALLTG